MTGSMDNWKEVRLGSVLRYLDERVPLDDEKEYFTITVKRRHGGLEMREKLFGHQIATKKQYRLVPKAFIISRVQCWHQAYAIVGDVPPNAIASINYDQFAISSDADPRFFWWLSHSPAFNESVRSSASGVVIEKMVFDRETWLTKSIRLPPLPEQWRLVARIEELTGQIQEARSLRHQATLEVEALKSGIEIHRSLIPLGNKFGWEPLGSVARVQGGYAFKSEDLQDCGVPVVKIANVSDGRLDWSNRTYIPENRLREFHQFAIEEDDFLIAMTRPVIRGAIKVARVQSSELPCLLNQRVGRFQRIQDRMSREFFFRVLLSQYFRREVEARCEGGQQPNIGGKEIESIPIPIPPLAEQHQVVAELDALQVNIDSVRRLQRETDAELDALLPAILDRAFKGELV